MDRRFGDIKKCTSTNMLIGFCTGVLSALGEHDIVTDICEAQKNIKRVNSDRKCDNKECEYFVDNVCNCGYISQPQLQCSQFKDYNKPR
tara:strand:+ start:416 stop:682 length:267 start_codon:yes stop_codon:yes gene_type:complete